MRGIAEVSEEAVETAKRILALKAQCEEALAGNNYIRYVDYFFEEPFITKKSISKKFDIAQPTAGRVVDYFCEKGVLDDITPNKERYKSYAFTKYINILKAGTEL